MRVFRTTRDGALIVNADDWGRTRETTDRTLECLRCRAVSSVSAMVFMEDSERAAMIAQEHGIDTGLHLNFTTAFSGDKYPAALIAHHQRIAAYLLRHSLAPVVFNPWLRSSFEYVVESQLAEFERIYGRAPNRLDGHHHMHLCANVLLGGLLPSGTIVRRHFTFNTDEKNVVNRTYRKMSDRFLARRHQVVDRFLSLPPLTPPSRIQRIVDEARRFVVEIETHPINTTEHQFLVGGDIFRYTGNLSIAHGFVL